MCLRQCLGLGSAVKAITNNVRKHLTPRIHICGHKSSINLWTLDPRTINTEPIETSPKRFSPSSSTPPTVYCCLPQCFRAFAKLEMVMMLMMMTVSRFEWVFIASLLCGSIVLPWSAEGPIHPTPTPSYPMCYSSPQPLLQMSISQHRVQ